MPLASPIMISIFCHIVNPLFLLETLTQVKRTLVSLPCSNPIFYTTFGSREDGQTEEVWILVEATSGIVGLPTIGGQKPAISLLSWRLATPQLARISAHFCSFPSSLKRVRIYVCGPRRWGIQGGWSTAIDFFINYQFFQMIYTLLHHFKLDKIEKKVNENIFIHIRSN